MSEQPTTEASFWKLKKGKEPNLSGDPGKSLTQEVTELRDDVQKLCAAVRSLVKLQTVMDQKLDAAITKGSV